ncbi:GNAT family N-acetyltransferase [Longimicrobium sp.]|uniref:GNAT family N-acetyltransferase n=1 Tax=Longimicrobium sp. TaxID=2029185 RepID=UPI002E329936|nr:GNAT family N-acetyltransferase [Longimicrobium sp.]HEX6040906.1 GNAT family N-acetyltransferase [Longimicrobium sp.]
MSSTADDGLRADPRIVETWVRGWTLARETAPPVPVGSGFRVEVGWPRQRVRYIFPALDDDVRRLGQAVTEPWIHLKACVPPDALRAALPARWVIQPPGFMMACDGPMAHSAAALPDGYTLDLADERPIAVARVLDARGEVAAIGRMVRVDDFALYDRIETHAAHRRRGLARAVMQALETTARARGARRGVLVATAEGRALYEALGWRLHARYTTAVIPAD